MHWPPQLPITFVAYFSYIESMTTSDSAKCLSSGVPQKKMKLNGFVTTWGWVNDDRTIHLFRRTNRLKPSLTISQDSSALGSKWFSFSLYHEKNIIENI